MLAAQKKYYSETYIYPQRSFNKRSEWKVPQKPAVTMNTQSGIYIPVKARKRMVICILFLMGLFIGTLAVSANESSIKFEINKINIAIIGVEKEIEALNLTLEKERSIVKLEEKAINELGMVYPTANHIYYLESTVPPLVAANNE